jgi:hypothetical protein
MKLNYKLIVLSLLSFSLLGCSNDDAESVATPVAEQSTTPGQPSETIPPADYPTPPTRHDNLPQWLVGMFKNNDNGKTLSGLSNKLMLDLVIDGFEYSDRYFFDLSSNGNVQAADATATSYKIMQQGKILIITRITVDSVNLKFYADNKDYDLGNYITN